MPEFKTSVLVDAAPEKVFDFLARPENVVKISPPDLGLRFLNAPELLELGSRFEFQVQSWGQVQKMVHEVITFDRPMQLIEKQVQGPFRLWIHERTISTTPTGQALLTDVIEFQPPGGLIGLLLTPAKITDHLEDGFFYRHERLRKLLTEST